MEIKIAIIGGKLRGIEIAFLADMAGIYTILIDKDNITPASSLCDENYVFDVEKKEPALLAILKNVDIVIPAVEKKEALEAIEDMCREINLKVAFDFTAYDVTTSRIQADLLINEENFPHLEYYPEALPPYVLKPAVGNRRRSIKRVDTVDELEFLISRKNSPESWIAQEYVKGPIFSIEVVGRPGDYSTFEVTQLHLEKDFDCSMVSCPSSLDQNQQKDFAEKAIILAKNLQLTGIMEVEGVIDNGILKLMELNAIFPSQKPTTVFFSTGINMLLELLNVFADDKVKTDLNSLSYLKYDKPKHVRLKDFQFFNRTPTFKGEGYLKRAGALKIMVDFFGCDYAITDYIDDDHEWQAAFINIADTEKELLDKRILSRETLFEHFRKLFSASII